MNTDISPLKQFSYLSPKHNIASFKKFNPRSPKNDQQSKQISPFKYMNTEANPQIGKNMTQSAHHLGYNYVKHQTSTKPGTAKKQEFMKSINFLDKNSTLTPNSQLNKNFLSPHRLEIDMGNSIRNRKLSYNDLGTDKMAVRIAQRKSELKPNTETQDDEEMPQMRDRKLSYQVSANHLHSQQQQPSFKKDHQWSNTTNSNTSFLSPQSHRRLSDLSPGVFPSRNKIDFGQTVKMHPQVTTSHSHPHIPHNDHPKTSFPTFNQSKFRKNSYTDQQQKDPKTQVPSFLLKKIKKQNQQPSSKPIQPFPANKPRASTYIPQTQEPTKQRTFSLKDFQLLKQLGEGKFGKVLLVKEKTSGFVCAMKVFKKSQIKADNFIDQFIRQMKIQLFLNHPNIIKMYGYFDDLSFIYILLEVASEGTLYGFLQNLHRQERLKNSGHSQQKHQQGKSGLTGLNLKQTAVIMYQLCSGIKYLHANEIIHRDLKPQNIVIHQKTIKLCDFGWSVFKGSQMRTTFCGTPLYLCPQLITGEQYDEKADIWAIGVMLYEFLVGPNPFNIRQQADLTNIISQKVNLEQQGKLDDTVIDLINGCLDKDPHQRYDIKQIVNHEFFKKYCPELMLGASGNLARQSSMGVSEMMK